MWSLKQGLALVHSHLPAGFDASHGIKLLFPAGYSGSISPLKGYVFSAYARLGAYYGFGGKPGTSSYIPDSVLVESVADTYVMADGTGRWYFSWLGQNLQFNSAEMTSFFIQSGFVFHFSNDGNAHGFVDTSQPLITSTDSLLSGDYRNCISGQDDWIAKNWPQIFAAGRHVLLWEGKDAPDPSEVWTGAGFAKPNFTQLNGSAGVCAPTTSGSTLFPYPSGPVRKPSPASLVLCAFMANLGSAMGSNPASIPRTLTSGGLTFNTTVPAGMNPGDPGTVQCNFASSDSKINGTYSWDLPGTGSQSNGTFEIDVSDGKYTIVYNYKNDSTSTTLTSKVTFAGSDGSSSTFSQSAVNGLVRSQTSVTTDTSGHTTTTSLTISGDGVLHVSGLNLNQAAAIGVTGSRAQIVDLVASVSTPISNFTSSAGFGGPSTGTQGTIPTPLGPITVSTTLNVNTFTSASSWNANTTYPLTTGSLSVSYSFIPSVVAGVPQSTTVTTATLQGNDFTSAVIATYSVQSLVAPWGQVTTEISQVTCADGSTSNTTVQFNADNSFTIEITTTDASGNGSMTTINCDQTGNATSQETVPLGDLGTGTGDNSMADGGSGDGGTGDGSGEGGGEEGSGVG